MTATELRLWFDHHVRRGCTETDALEWAKWNVRNPVVNGGERGVVRDLSDMQLNYWAVETEIIP